MTDDDGILEGRGCEPSNRQVNSAVSLAGRGEIVGALALSDTVIVRWRPL